MECKKKICKSHIQQGVNIQNKNNLQNSITENNLILKTEQKCLETFFPRDIQMAKR